ncbi:MAG TPA: hypothetical protein VMD97_08275 [Candidatus Aquilonibacter sp.]|nr:hypothetical protein [Candidatus Aquilonibacter sp.]
MTNAVILIEVDSAVILSAASQPYRDAESKDPEAAEFTHIAQPFSTTNSAPHHTHPTTAPEVTTA